MLDEYQLGEVKTGGNHAKVSGWLTDMEGSARQTKLGLVKFVTSATKELETDWVLVGSELFSSVEVDQKHISGDASSSVLLVGCGDWAETYSVW